MPDKNHHLKSYQCFVCEDAFQLSDIKYHGKVHMPVCLRCYGSDAEKQKSNELLNDLADGFVCGCI